MKAVLCKVNEEAKIVDIDDDLDTLQSIVGGFIEIAHLLEDRNCCLVLNDIGRLIPLPPNRAITNKKGEVIDVIFGDFAIFYEVLGAEGGEFADMPDELAEKYQKMFKYPLGEEEYV